MPSPCHYCYKNTQASITFLLQCWLSAPACPTPSNPLTPISVQTSFVASIKSPCCATAQQAPTQQDHVPTRPVPHNPIAHSDRIHLPAGYRAVWSPDMLASVSTMDPARLTGHRSHEPGHTVTATIAHNPAQDRHTNEHLTTHERLETSTHAFIQHLVCPHQQITYQPSDLPPETYMVMEH